ncbi:MAG: glycosyltransferase family 4 protein [Candidatus Fermentibacter sp.]|nr:glycosyltransferase family 4 protein [Candidatus Fermentibacter sp.]
MRILLISTSFPSPDADGSEAAGSFALDFSTSLSRKADVSVVCPALSRSLEKGPPEIRRFAVPRLPLGDIKPSSPASWPRIASVLSSGQKAVDAAVDEFQPDHILALWALPSGWWARKAAGRRRIGYSTWSLGSDIWSLGRIPFVKSALRSVLAGSQCRFADGIRLCSDVEKICGRKCLFLPSSRDLGIDTPPAKRSSPPYRLAFLGRWHRNKGIDILMEVLDMLTDADWQMIEEVRLFGGGPLCDLVNSSAAGLQRAGRPVRTGGYIGRAEAADLLCWADFILIPSRIESIPVILSDALQSRTPLIVSTAGDLAELVGSSLLGVAAHGVPSPESFITAVREALALGPSTFRDGIERTSASFDPDGASAMFLEEIATSGR